MIAWLTVLLIGLFVFFHDWKSPVYRAYLWLSITITIWVSGCFMESTFIDADFNVLVDKFLYTGAAFAPTAFFHSILVIINKAKKLNRLILLGYLFSTIFLILNFFFRSLYIPEVTRKISFRYISTPGPLWYLYILFFVGFTFYGLYELYKARIESRGSRKNQLRWLSIAYTTVIIAAVFYLLLVFNIETPPVDNFLVVVYSLIMAYAILKHRLMDIEIVIKKTVYYSILTALLTGIFHLVIVFSNLLFQGIAGYSSFWASFVAIFSIAVIFHPLREKIQDYVDRIFSRQQYEYRKILREYSYALSKPALDLRRFSKLTPYLVAKNMKLKNSAVLVLDRMKRVYSVRRSYIYGSSPKSKRKVLLWDKDIWGKEINLESPLVQHLRRGRILNIDEIEDEKLKEEMNALKAKLCIPSVSRSEYFGEPTLLSILVLGEKLSEAGFSNEDITFLEILSHQSTISVEYSFIFEELRKNQEILLKNEKLATIGMVASSISHEFKNPLTSLTTIAEVFPQKINDPKFLKMISETLSTQTTRMKIMVEGILDTVRNIPPRFVPTNLQEHIFAKLKVMLKEEIVNNKIELVEEYLTDKMVKADRSRMMFVLLNLMMNAIQAMKEREKRTLLIQTSVDETLPDFVMLRIIDTGAGIPPEIVNRIFDPLFTTKEKGTGLGLSMVKGIVEQHGGKIGVSSQVGTGTTFSILLPVA